MGRQKLSASWQTWLLLALLGVGQAGAAPYIRRVVFVSEPIFSQSEREQLRWLPLGLVDRLHADTRQRVVERELVFRRGDELDPAELEESERKLRGLGLFRDVELQTLEADADSVDVLVRTREVWTTEVSANYERFEGQRLWAIGVRERNFLGMARSLSFSASEDEDRKSWGLGLGDRQMLDGTWRGNIGFSDSDDGTATAWSLDKPFFRLDATWSAELDYLNAGARERFYLNSTQYVRPQFRRHVFSLRVLRHWQSDESGVWRWGLGIGSRDQHFAGEEGLGLFNAQGFISSKAGIEDGVDETRQIRYASGIVRRVTRRYAKLLYIDAMGQVEDIPLGGETDLEIGWASRAFGGSLAGLRLGAGQSWVAHRSEQLIMARVGTEGLISTDKAVDLRLTAGLTGHLKLHPDWRVAAALFGGTGSAMDRNRLYSLGIDSGLRAASFREFAGDRIVRGNLELRWVHRPGLLGLVTPGLTAFADVGSAWYERERDLRLEDLRGAVGVGLRLGFRQGSQFVPVRVDLAWPVLYDIDRPKPVLSIGTGQVF